MKTLRKKIHQVQADMTDSSKLILSSFVCLAIAEILGAVIFDCWRDMLIAFVVGILAYSCLQALVVVRYGSMR